VKNYGDRNNINNTFKKRSEIRKSDGYGDSIFVKRGLWKGKEYSLSTRFKNNFTARKHFFSNKLLKYEASTFKFNTDCTTKLEDFSPFTEAIKPH
jgi:hypothetical protein